MNSNARLAGQIALVVAVASAASAWWVHARSSHTPTWVSVTADVSTPEIEEAPATVQAEPVAKIAQARVERLQSAGVAAGGIKPISLKTPEPIRAAAELSVSRLKKIRACEKEPTAACPIKSAMATTSASGYSDQLVDETVAELAFLKALAEAEAAEHRAPSFSVTEVAGAYVKHRDDNVREQALGLASLAVQSNPAAVVDIASRALKSTISGPLASQALELLEASRESNPQLVDKTLISTLKTGGWDVRDTVADKLLPFLTPANRDSFSHILASAPPRSKLALRMRLNIEEFDRMDRL